MLIDILKLITFIAALITMVIYINELAQAIAINSGEYKVNGVMPILFLTIYYITHYMT